jgi:hypothetical protein
MKTQQHYSPGPWHTQGCTIYAGKNRVAQTWDTWYDGLPTPTMEADAGLIAAAPEMLAALEMALESLDAVDVPQEWDCRSKVRAAIAKARGGAR